MIRLFLLLYQVAYRLVTKATQKKFESLRRLLGFRVTAQRDTRSLQK